MYKIYLLISPSGKMYVGQTKLKLSDRWRNGKGYRKSKVLYSAIKKYGFENFKHILLEDGIPDRDSANEREKYYIHYYNTITPNGYNISKGGYTNDCNFLKKPVIAIDANGDKLYFESICKCADFLNRSGSTVSQAIKKKNMCNGYYIFYDNEELSDFSNILKVIHVYKYDTKKLIGIYNSITEASIATNTNISGVSKILNHAGERGCKSANGFIFSYSEIDDFSDYSRGAKKYGKRKIDKRSKKIGMYNDNGDLIKTFNSISSAGKYFGKTSNSNIYNSLQNNCKAYGYYFRFIQEKSA